MSRRENMEAEIQFALEEMRRKDRLGPDTQENFPRREDAATTAVLEDTRRQTGRRLQGVLPDA